MSVGEISDATIEEGWGLMKKIGFALIMLAFISLISATGFSQGKSDDLLLRHHRVGHFIRTINVIGFRGETRSVNVNLWYPALSSEDCENFGKSVANSGSSDADSGHSDMNGDDGDCSANPSVYSSRIHGAAPRPEWTIGTTESFDNLPISRERPFPVIVFSHGNQGNAIDYVYTLEALASYGFIVAAPDHVNDTQDDIRIDYFNSNTMLTPIPCFDGLPFPCEIMTRVLAENHVSKDPSIPCRQSSKNVSTTTVSVLESLTDRVRDVSATIDALPEWFGHRADTSRVGVMGHSRGTVTTLASAGGSACWDLAPDPRVKAIMGLAIGARPITFAVDVQNINVPALLVAGTRDTTADPSISQDAFKMLSSTEKAFVLIEDAKHRHFDSGLCAQTQSSGAIAKVNPDAILDLQTVTNLLIFRSSGVAMDFCRYDTFTNPTDITGLVRTLTGFNVTPNNVPTVFDGDEQKGLDSDQVKDKVVQLAVIFFGHVLDRDSDDDPPFMDFLPPSVPDPTLTRSNLLTQVP